MCTEPLFGGLEEWGLRELPLDPAPLSVPNLDRCSTGQFAQLSGDAAARGTREPVRAGARQNNSTEVPRGYETDLAGMHSSSSSSSPSYFPPPPPPPRKAGCLFQTKETV